MKKMTVGELSKLYGIHRQSIYKRINKGDLSKSADGKIDFAEAIRVFGEPDGRGAVVTTVQSTQVQIDTQVDKLQLQVEMLEKQLKKAEENEQFLKEADSSGKCNSIKTSHNITGCIPAQCLSRTII